MEQLTTLSTPTGRAVIQRAYFALVERASGTSILLTMLRVCTGAIPVSSLLKNDTSVQHPLGFRKGFSLFMQEIVYTHYLTSIHALVYFGAAVLLTVVGLYRFTSSVSEPIVVAAVILEAVLLGLLFLVGMFAPPDYDAMPPTEESEAQQLVREIGEISADYAGFTMQIESITQAMSGIQHRLDELIASVNEMSRAATAATSPPTEMLTVMSSTTSALQQFEQTVRNLVAATDDIRDRELRLLVRNQLEEMIVASSKQQAELTQKGVS